MQNSVHLSCKGVSGCGKSTLATNIANALGIPMKDGDELHPKSNVDKMSRGIPLTDSDREPWLALIRKTAETLCDRGEKDSPRGVVIACSSLKTYYREILRGRVDASHAPPPAHDIPTPITEAKEEEIEKELLAESATPELRTFFVYIHGSQEVLERRMAERKGHFMKVEMLKSQLETLQDPRAEDGVVTVNLEDSPEEQMRNALEGLKKVGFGPGVNEVS